MEREVVVVSVGGSLINPSEIQVNFLLKLKKFIMKSRHKFVLICGGGINARTYQKAAREFSIGNKSQDEIGIAATMLNAELVRHIFKAPPVQQEPKKMGFNKVLVAAGWKPGCSTDYDAVLWAKKFNSKTIVNLSNTDYVYDKDPRKYRSAKPLKCISWKEYKKMISAKWTAGFSSPFDPVATRAAEKMKMHVFCMNGKRLNQLSKALRGESFIGTVIG